VSGLKSSVLLNPHNISGEEIHVVKMFIIQPGYSAILTPKNLPMAEAK